MFGRPAARYQRSQSIENSGITYQYRKYTDALGLISRRLNVKASIESSTYTYNIFSLHFPVEYCANFRAKNVYSTTKRGDCGKLAISLRNRFKCNLYAPCLVFARALISKTLAPQNKATCKIFRKTATPLSACFALPTQPGPPLSTRKGPAAHHRQRNDPVTSWHVSLADARTRGVRWEFSVTRTHGVPWCSRAR